jgi:hypothetical protein
MPGDLQSPLGKIDMRDIAFVARGFGTKLGDALCNPNTDINDDDKVDMKDVAIVARDFGKTDP